MKERIAKLLGNGTATKLILGTFHSVCRRYLVNYGHLIGIQKGFGIADSSDSISIIKRIIKRLGLNTDPRKAQSRISSSKSRGISHEELAQQQASKKNVEQQEFVIVFEAYQSQLAKSNLLDYDDLLLRCVDLLRQHPTCVSNVEVVLIDEFQDTNVVQFDLMRLFASKNKRVTTVGDPDQSIYGWRSAEIKNLKRMKSQYPDTLVISLKENYRSSGAILLAANEVIEQDESRPTKPLLPTHCPGTIPVLRKLPSAEIEASWIVSEILRTAALTGRLLVNSDYAVLLRSASLSRHVESAMGKAGIPYRMVGGQRFFDRTEVKILLDYLRVIAQPNNNDAISRIINVPARGLSAATVKILLNEAETRAVTLWTLVRDAATGNKKVNFRLSRVAEQGLGSFINIILTTRNKTLDLGQPHSPEDLLKYIIKRLEFQTYLKKCHADDHEARWTNVQELVAQASEYPVIGEEASNEGAVDDMLPYIEGLEQQRCNAAEEALSKFLANVALATELQKEEDIEASGTQSQVTISTIHAAKGLEWPVVFVPSAYEGCIPHSRAEDIDEERRLLYVAMTRAQALLYISCPTKNSQREETTLSSFLSTKKVGRLLCSKGPNINSGAVNDISRILRTGTPTPAEIYEACKTLHSIHDDLWPLTGEDDVKATQARWSKWDSNESDMHRHMSKRRRIQGAEASEVVHTENSHTFSKISSATTMQNISNFSYSGSAGFTTAASHIHCINKQEEVDSSINREGQLKTRGDSAQPCGKSKSTLSRRGQGNLTTFLGMGEKLEPQARDDVASAIPANVNRGPLTGRSQSSYPSHHNSDTAAWAFSAQGLSATFEPVPKTPLLPIPQGMAAHRLSSLPSSGRPYLPTEEAAPAKKHYVFLSSPPPPVEAMGEAAHARCKEPYAQDAGSKLEDSGTPLPHADIRPAKTFHHTSVMQSGIRPATKTLGVRRSMKGWAARGSQPFSIPRMAGSGL